MNDTEYHQHVDLAFARIERAIDALDPDDVELDKGGGYLTLAFRDKSRCVISAQRPAREIWMASDTTAWHFAMSSSGAWIAQKTQEELFATVARVLSAKMSGVAVSV